MSKSERYYEELRQLQAYAQENHAALVQLGGRPTRPIQWDVGPRTVEEGPDDCSSGEEDDEQRESRWITDHWAHEGSKFAQELKAWQAFRSFQRRLRTKPIFLREQRVNDYWNERGIKEALKPQLLHDPEQQSKVNEWKEYYWFQYRQLPAYEKRIVEEERKTERWLEEFDAATVQTGCSDRPLGKKWLYGEWQSRDKIIEIGDCRTRCAASDRDIHASTLEWIEGQLPIIAAEQVSVIDCFSLIFQLPRQIWQADIKFRLCQPACMPKTIHDGPGHLPTVASLF